MGIMAFNLPVYQVADHNTPGLAIDHDQVQHFTAGKHLNFTVSDLAR